MSDFEQTDEFASAAAYIKGATDLNQLHWRFATEVRSAALVASDDTALGQDVRALLDVMVARRNELTAGREGSR